MVGDDADLALGPSLSGTSNTFLAYKYDLEAMGTNAHELPMAMAALADGDEELHESQYRVLELWQKSYGGRVADYAARYVWDDRSF